MTLPKELTTVTPLSKALALVLFISLPIVGFLYGMRYQRLTIKSNLISNKVDTFTPQINNLQAKKTADTVPSLYPSLLPTDTTGWKLYTNDTFNYSILAPSDMYTYLCDTATFNAYCEGTDDFSGVYKSKADYPYGVKIIQTVIKGFNPERDINPFDTEYNSAHMIADIDFGVPDVKMSQGKDVEYGVGEKITEYYYTKYIFRKGDFFYIASIQTDEAKTNYDLYKKILSTWQFE